MRENHSSYLSEMGISTWQLTHPERLLGYQAKKISPVNDCQLLLVMSEKPSQNYSTLLQKIAQSMGLTLSQVGHVFPRDISTIDQQALRWVWFCGCDPIALDHSDISVLISPSLAVINASQAHKRHLWHQIKQSLGGERD